MNNKIRFWISWILLMAALLQFTGCGHRNDAPSADSQMPVASVSQQMVPSDTKPSYEKTGDFYSTDGSVHFQWNLSMSEEREKIPVVDVVPHRLTDAQAETVANVLFAGAVFYEAEDTLEKEYSREELANKLDIWKQYATPEAYGALFPYRVRLEDEGYIEEKVQVVEGFIEEYTQLLTQAPEEKQDKLYDWVFRIDKNYGKGYRAECTYQGIPYYLSSDGKNFDAYIHTGISPTSIEEAHYRASLCRTKKPDQGQVEAIVKKAETMIQKMNIGSWYIETIKLNQDNLATQSDPVWEYTIDVLALPSYLNHPALAWTAANTWPQERMRFLFAPDGTLLNFQLPAVYDFDSFSGDEMGLSLDVLLETAQNALSKYTCADFGMSMDFFAAMEASYGEPVLCRAEIISARFGLLLGEHPQHAGKMRYVPSMILDAQISYCGETTGKTYLTEEQNFGTPVRRLLALSVLDGSVMEYPY